MEEEDFFKDYPPAEGSFEQSAAAEPDSPDAQPIFLGAPLDVPEDAAPPANGAANGNSSYDDDDAHVPLDAPPPADASAAENAAVTQWRLDFARRLEESVAHERRVRNERSEKAADLLAGMQSRWVKSCKDAADANQRADREFVRARDGLISRMTKPGQTPNWDLVPQLVDLTGTFKEGQRDTSRMRQVLQRMAT